MYVLGHETDGWRVRLGLTGIYFYLLVFVDQIAVFRALFPALINLLSNSHLAKNFIYSMLAFVWFW
jgi:hypothetical protein